MKTRNGASAVPQCLTIAGSDSGGGAGIQADLKTFEANGVYGLSIVTSITAQNTQRVARAYDLPEDLILSQLQAVFEDFAVTAAKTGMLSSKSIVSTISAFWRSLGPAAPPLVVDPVMISKSGYPLLQLDAVARVRKELLPLATVVTPNRHEAELLSGVSLAGRDDVEAAGWKILALGPKAVLLKGGHLDGPGLDPSQATDFLFADGKIREFSSPRVETNATHGTGCTYSAAIAAWLGRGYTISEAVSRAKRYLYGAIRHSRVIGHGHGPMHHFFFMPDWTKVLERAAGRTSGAEAAPEKAARATSGRKAATAGPRMPARSAKKSTARTITAKKNSAKKATTSKIPAKKAATKSIAARKSAAKNSGRVPSKRAPAGASRATRQITSGKTTRRAR